MSRKIEHRVSAAVIAACLIASVAAPAIVRAEPIGFGSSVLAGTSGSMPTTLAWGPDGRLYTGHFDGRIRAYTVVRDGKNDYRVIGTETITKVASIPNHDDDGTSNASVDTRLLLGLLVTGTAAHPVIYASSSDPRIGGGITGDDLGLDTNSGTLSRIVWNGSTWIHTVMVRGLPRSEENHAPNGIALSDDGDTLYWAYGGHTNQGGPSFKFANLPEYAYSGAVLEVDLPAITDPPYDMPTLDDPSRANAGGGDVNDPFGGNDGDNQAKITAGSPVQLYATGFRNPYDLVLATVGSHAGKLYLSDNGSNKTWGAPPTGEGTQSCTNQHVSDGDDGSNDALHLVTPGYYGGHPNPTRGNASNTFNGQSPIVAEHPVECDFRSSKTVETTSLSLLPNSSDGIAEYTTANFGGAMEGDLLLAAYGPSKIARISLNAAGTAVTLRDDDFRTFASPVRPLDITTMNQAQAFPGTIWIAAFQSGDIHVMEPNDFSFGGGCTGQDSGALDEDDDGYSNADEIDNGTNPCSSASTPPDADGDLESDLNDPDDDDDGRLDDEDPFALDPDDGTTTSLPVTVSWGDPGSSGGIADTGFTGLMTDGVTDYLDLYATGALVVGGPDDVLGVKQVPAGDAYAGINTQRYGFQLGVEPPGSGAFKAVARIVDPFRGLTPAAGQSMGLAIGSGTQSSYVKLVIQGNDGGRLQVAKESGDTIRVDRTTRLSVRGIDALNLTLRIDPATGTVRASAVAITDGDRSRTKFTSPIVIPSAWYEGPNALAVGVISTSRGSGDPFPASWGFVRVRTAG